MKDQIARRDNAPRRQPISASVDGNASQEALTVQSSQLVESSSANCNHPVIIETCTDALDMPIDSLPR